MGQGTRVTFANASSHEVRTGVKDQDWIAEMSNLNNDLSPDQKQENGYFEYNAGHTGHITLTFRTSKADCTLGLVDIDVMPDRTVTEDGDLKINYTISTISGARFIAVTMVDN